MRTSGRPLTRLLVVVNLAVTIGAAATVFAVAQRTLWSGLPFDHPDEIVLIEGVATPPTQQLEIVRAIAEGPSFAHAASLRPGGVEYRLGSHAGRLVVVEASEEFFDVMAAGAVIGRTFLPDDARIGSERVALLGDGWWRRQFDASPDVVGRSITLQGTPYRVIGVAPSRLDVLGGADVFMLRHPADPGSTISVSAVFGRNMPGGILARLEPGISLEQAALEVRAREAARPRARGMGKVPPPDVTRLADKLKVGTREMNAAATAAIGLLAGLGCANVALLCAGWFHRRRIELATRLALGAGLRRLIALVIVEHAALTAVAAAAGLLIVVWSGGLLTQLLPDVAHLIRDWRFDSAVLLFAAAAASASLLVVAAISALGLRQIGRTDLARLLNTGGGSRPPSARRFQRTAVAFQLALGATLLGTAVLLARGVHALEQVDPGFEPSNLLVMQLWRPPFQPPPSPGAPQLTRAELHMQHQLRFHALVYERLAGLPGILHAGGTNWLPLTRLGHHSQYVHTGDPKQGLTAELLAVSGSYFEVLGIPILRGHAFTSTGSAAGTAVVDEIAAAALWPGQDPVGRMLHISRGERPRVVVGVVPSVRGIDLTSKPRGRVYYPLSLPSYVPSYQMLVLRTAAPPSALVPLVRAALREIDSDVVAYDVQTGDGLLASALAPARARSGIAWLFAIFAAIVSAVGMFVATSQWWLERRPERTIRMILCATRAHMFRLAFGQGAVVLAVGCALGMFLAWTAGRAIQGFIFVVEADLFSMLPGVGLAAGIAALTIWSAAYRAVRNTELRL